MLSNLAGALGLLGNATGDRSVLRLVVALFEQVVELRTEATAARADALVELVGGLLAIYEDDGDPDRVERAVALCRPRASSRPAAWAWPTPRSRRRPGWRAQHS